MGQIKNVKVILEDLFSFFLEFGVIANHVLVRGNKYYFFLYSISSYELHLLKKNKKGL
jgi:hypothetical protein